MSPVRALRAAALAVVVALTATGCGFDGIYSLPLPGEGKGDNSYQIKVELADALDLVPFSAVKVNNATVGHVKEVRLDKRHALVIAQLKDSVRLPANAVAMVQETSLLGEKFVEIHPPTEEAPRGRLTDGDTIPLGRTDTSATVEEVLSALSLLLNGGGVEQIRTISTELNAALAGREDSARSLLEQLDIFVTGLDEQKAEILRAIEGLNRLGATVRAQQSTVNTALERIPPAIGILAEDRAQLTELLVSMDELGTVATKVLNDSRDSMLANLRALEPTVRRLAEVGEIIPRTLETFISYPVADGVENQYFGDYGNLWLEVDLSGEALQRVLREQGIPLPTTGPTPNLPLPLPLPSPGVPVIPQKPSLPGGPSVPSVPDIIDRLGPIVVAGYAPNAKRSSGTNLDSLLLGGLR